MGKENTTSLTSLYIDDRIWEDFKVQCIKRKFSLNKLCNRAIDLYLTDEEFRKKIHNHNNITFKSGEENKNIS